MRRSYAIDMKDEPDSLFPLPPLASGGLIALAACPGRHRGAAADVAAYRAWGATDVLSLTQAHELPDEAALETALHAAGLAWHRFPIADYGVPDAGSAWPDLAPRLHAALDRGGRLVLHCWGGRGRSGMVAARLLVERGASVEEAGGIVRTARPGAVETPEQEAWVARGLARA